MLWKAAAADFAQIGFRHVGCKVLCTQYTIQYINVLPFLAYGIWFRNSNMLEQAGRNWNRQMNILEPELLSAFWFPIPRKHPDMEALLSICAGEHPPLRGARPSTIGSPSVLERTIVNLNMLNTSKHQLFWPQRWAFPPFTTP